MSKFKITKKFSLDFLGDEWKDSYILFTPLTVNDISEKIVKLTKIDVKSENETRDSFATILEILKEHFIGGSGIGNNGEVVEIKSDDIGELPAEVIAGALSFLSQGLAASKEMPSNMPSEE